MNTLPVVPTLTSLIILLNVVLPSSATITPEKLPLLSGVLKKMTRLPLRSFFVVEKYVLPCKAFLKYSSFAMFCPLKDWSALIILPLPSAAYSSFMPYAVLRSLSCESHAALSDETSGTAMEAADFTSCSMPLSDFVMATLDSSPIDLRSFLTLSSSPL